MLLFLFGLTAMATTIDDYSPEDLASRSNVIVEATVGSEWTEEVHGLDVTRIRLTELDFLKGSALSGELILTVPSARDSEGYFRDIVGVPQVLEGDRILVSGASINDAYIRAVSFGPGVLFLDRGPTVLDGQGRPLEEGAGPWTLPIPAVHTPRSVRQALNRAVSEARIHGSELRKAQNLEGHHND